MVDLAPGLRAHGRRATPTLGSPELLDRDIFGGARGHAQNRLVPGVVQPRRQAERREADSGSVPRWATSAGTASVGNTAVVVLDSNVHPPGSAQAALPRRLALASCFTSPPAAPSALEPRTAASPGLRRSIVPLVEKNGVQVVFDGHLHAYARSRPHNGVLYVAVGTGGAELDYDAGGLTIPSARVVQGRFGALRVDVAGNRARFRYQTVDGRVRDDFRLSCP
jgi:hypothetical protein